MVHDRLWTRPDSFFAQYHAAYFIVQITPACDLEPIQRAGKIGLSVATRWDGWLEGGGTIILGLRLTRQGSHRPSHEIV